MPVQRMDGKCNAGMGCMLQQSIRKERKEGEDEHHWSRELLVDALGFLEREQEEERQRQHEPVRANLQGRKQEERCSTVRGQLM